MSPDDAMNRGLLLARQAAGGVEESHLAQVLAHLKRHRDLQATLALLERLPRSPFAERSGQTRRQLAALAELVRPELRRSRDWREAALIVGWARRLLRSFER